MRHAVMILVLVLGFPAAGRLSAMDGPAGQTPLARRIQRSEALLHGAWERVRMAEAEHAARAVEAPDDWVATARADAARFEGEGIIKVRRAEAAVAEANLHDEQCWLFGERAVPDRKRLPFNAMIQLCRQRAEKAEGVAILAVQDAMALAAQASSRRAMAEAMARCAAFSGSRSVEHLEAVLAACEDVVAALRLADNAVGVHRDFLEAQEADFNRVLATLLPADS